MKSSVVTADPTAFALGLSALPDEELVRPVDEPESNDPDGIEQEGSDAVDESEPDSSPEV
jgi:hypothetical protein